MDKARQMIIQQIGKLQSELEALKRDYDTHGSAKQVLILTHMQSLGEQLDFLASLLLVCLKT